LDDILVYFFLKMSRQGFELGSGWPDDFVKKSPKK
jgi:hypothetical protein